MALKTNQQKLKKTIKILVSQYNLFYTFTFKTINEHHITITIPCKKIGRKLDTNCRSSIIKQYQKDEKYLISNLPEISVQMNYLY